MTTEMFGPDGKNQYSQTFKRISHEIDELMTSATNIIKGMLPAAIMAGTKTGVLPDGAIESEYILARMLITGFFDDRPFDSRGWHTKEIEKLKSMLQSGTVDRNSKHDDI